MNPEINKLRTLADNMGAKLLPVMENKVIIEITPKGWTKKVILNGKEFTEDWKLTRFGGQNNGESLEDIDVISDDLYEGLSSNDPYEIARALEEAGGDL